MLIINEFITCKKTLKNILYKKRIYNMSKYLEYFDGAFDSTVADKMKPENKPYVAYSRTEGVVYTVVPKPTTGPANNEIWYTTSNDSVLNLKKTNVFGANPVSNTYENGKGVITFDGDVTSVGTEAFYMCGSLSSITIPNSVTSIGNYAFNYCSALTSITIPNNVTRIGKEAFSSCISLKSVTLNAKNCADFSSSDSPFKKAYSQITSFTFGEGVEHIPAYICYDMSKLTNINIPDSVTGIGNSAFSGCSGLTSITIGNSVTSIRNYAFKNCSGLTSITLPNGVTSFGAETFSGCSKLTSVNIPDSVTNMGFSTFSGCSKLTSIAIPNGVTIIGRSTFGSCSSLTSVTIPDTVTTIQERAFSGCSSLTSITIPNSVINIENSIFGGCDDLAVTYEGTIEQWNAVTKHEEWNYEFPATYVQCSDGQVAL